MTVIDKGDGGVRFLESRGEPRPPTRGGVDR